MRKDRRRGEAQGDREYFLGSELAKPKRELSERCESGAGPGRNCSCLPLPVVLFFFRKFFFSFRGFSDLRLLKSERKVKSERKRFPGGFQGQMSKSYMVFDEIGLK